MRRGIVTENEGLKGGRSGIQIWERRAVRMSGELTPHSDGWDCLPQQIIVYPYISLYAKHVD